MSEEIEVETNEAPAQEIVETQESETPENEALEVESEEVETEAEESETPEVKPKSNGFQKRISKLTKQKAEKEREVEYWKQEALKAQKPQEQEVADQPKNSSDRPSEDDYSDYLEYVEAVAEWKVETKQKEFEEKRRMDAQQQKQVAQGKVFSERLDSFRNETPDFDEVIESVEEMPASDAVQEAIKTSEVPGHLMYELAKNPEELERLNSLSPIAASREIGKLEARFDKKELTAKTTTKAPRPLKTVGSGSGVKVVKDLGSPDLSFEEYEKARAKQRKAKG
jgi:hypothetical protein